MRVPLHIDRVQTRDVLLFPHKHFAHIFEQPLTVSRHDVDIDRVDRTDRGTRVIDYKTGADKTEFKDR